MLAKFYNSLTFLHHFARYFNDVQANNQYDWTQYAQPMIRRQIDSILQRLTLRNEWKTLSPPLYENKIGIVMLVGVLPIESCILFQKKKTKLYSDIAPMQNIIQ